MKDKQDYIFVMDSNHAIACRLYLAGLLTFEDASTIWSGKKWMYWRGQRID